MCGEHWLPRPVQSWGQCQADWQGDAIAFLRFLASAVLGQQPASIVPDQKLTPGGSFSITSQDLCVPGYTKKVRNVPAEMKRDVYEEYGVTSHDPGDYEVDHLIPLELGGSITKGGVLEARIAILW